MWLLDRRRPKDAFPVEVEHADGAVVGVKAGEGLGAEVARNGGVVVVDYKEKGYPPPPTLVIISTPNTLVRLLASL